MITDRYFDLSNTYVEKYIRVFVMVNSLSVLILVVLWNGYLTANVTTTKTTTQTNHKKTINNPNTYHNIIKRLIEQLNKDFTQYWLYKDMFNRPEELGVNQERLQKALQNLGDEKRLKQLLINALNGQKIELVTVGGSITQGATFAEKGKGFRIYFNAVRGWWNWIFSSITSSRMISRSVSVGGVGTDYFAYCLNAHIHEEKKPKLILWELSANDRGRYNDKPYPSSQPLEQFTRNVLKRISKPTLIHLHFFRGHDYLDGKCLNNQDEGGDMIARHYRITSLSWRNFVCKSMKERIPMFLHKNEFDVDKLHPSIFGHAQMAFLIINYLQNSFLRMLRNHALHTPSLSIFMQETARQGDIVLPSILFHETSTHKPRCFTFFLYNEYQPNSTLSPQILRHDDFSYNIFKQFKIRPDKLGGLQTFLSEQLLQLTFSLQETYSRLVMVTHAQTGNGQVWIDRDTPVLIETSNYTMGTKIELVTTHLTPGQHVLNVLSMHGGFAVCGVGVI